MAIQLDLFEDVFLAEDVLLTRIEKMERDIQKMRGSFFVRLNAQEKKLLDLKDELEKLKN